MPATHTVRKGDTLGAVARLHRTTVEVLVETNGLADPDAIRIGQALVIPEAPAAGPLAIDRTTLRLNRREYVGTRTPKNLVVLHHTAGGSAASSVRWWNEAPARIATAYVIDRDGTVFETFDPDFWASHLGVGGPIESRSIGIELANWGPLDRAGAGYRTYTGQTLKAAQVYDHGRSWRGERYFEAYPEPQVAAAIALTRHLVGRYGIDPDVAPDPFGGADVARFRRFEGVIAHCHVRTDKTDLHPGFPWERLRQSIEGGA